MSRTNTLLAVRKSALWVVASIVLATALCFALPQAALADGLDLNSFKKGTVTIVMNPHGKAYNTVTYTSYPKTGKISAVKVGNSKVLSAKVQTWKEGGKTYSILEVSLKKAGTSTLTFKFGKTKFSSKVRVVKHQNPVSVLKVGSKDYSSKFKRSYIHEASAGSLMGKLQVKPAKNWKVQSIEVYTGAKMKKVKNGAKLGSYKVERSIWIQMKNKKTGAVESLTIRDWEA